MLKVRQVKIDVAEDNDGTRLKQLCKKLRTNPGNILSYEISKQSLDARDKSKIFHVYEYIVDLKDESSIRIDNHDISLYTKEKYVYPCVGNSLKKVVIVGSGPAGLFAAYILAENGYKPVIIERGSPVEQRVVDVKDFWKTGILNPDSNVQFGEGGAGTFSDGKLNTLIKDENGRMRKVFETFVDCGAPKEILYSYKPHIGTDILRNVVINMRNKIIQMGGSFLYNTKMTDIVVDNNQITGIIVNDGNLISCDYLVLALGHSARDTFRMLYNRGLIMENKPFAVGVRVQHKQSDINLSQYGEKYARLLGSAPYKLTYNSLSKRGVYSFCMCPGGFVVNASSSKGSLVINGMSNHARNEENANSAIIVTVDENDYGSSALAGVLFQEQLEQKAYNLGNGKIPVQLLKDFCNNQVSTSYGKVNPIFKGSYTFANLNDLLPNSLNDSIKEAMGYFGTKIKGFDKPDTILAGVESRTSSPIKMYRNNVGEANIKGIFPCGEGAGYAGGITSSAIDGIKVAEFIGFHK